jgi:hypothetical protein
MENIKQLQEKMNTSENGLPAVRFFKKLGVNLKKSIRQEFRTVKALFTIDLLKLGKFMRKLFLTDK